MDVEEEAAASGRVVVAEEAAAASGRVVVEEEAVGGMLLAVPSAFSVGNARAAWSSAAVDVELAVELDQKSEILKKTYNSSRRGTPGNVS